MENLIPYVKGQRYNDKEPIEIATASMEDILELKRVAIMTDTFKQLKEAKTYTSFIKEYPCVAHYYPDKHLGVNAFFALQVGYCIEGVPSIAIIYVRNAYKAANNTCNKIVSKLSSRILEQFFTPGYFRNGMTLERLIQLVCDEKFVILENDKDIMYGTYSDEVLFSGEVYKVPKGFVEKYPVAQWVKKLNGDILIAPRLTLKGALESVQ